MHIYSWSALSTSKVSCGTIGRSEDLLLSRAIPADLSCFGRRFSMSAVSHKIAFCTSLERSVLRLRLHRVYKDSCVLMPVMCVRLPDRTYRPDHLDSAAGNALRL